MKNRLLLLSIPFLALSACSGNPSIDIDATFQIPENNGEEDLQQELIDQSLRVMDRRLQAMGDFIRESEVKETEDGVRFTLEAETEEALTELMNQLQQPFNLRIMAEAPEGSVADITVDGHGGFVQTGITGSDLEWVNSRKQEESSYGEIRLVFSSAGRVKMQELFQTNVGKNIGLFVNRQLVSKLLVDTNELKDDIVIRDIPNAELAEVFADDVNVGTHVTFTPVP